MPLSSAIVSLVKKSWKLRSHPFDKVRPFCSQTDPAATRRRWGMFFDDETETESSVYKHALKFQRPSTIVYKAQPVNSVSLIGTVIRELKRINTRFYSPFGVHTLLKVKASTQSKHSFLVLLKMWDEIAEMSANHLKPNDFVYVWGHLGSYVKADKNGDPRIAYEVNVQEINYVAENAEKLIYEPKKLDLHGKDYLERERDRLHLWQVFFANPYEWKDNRRSKVNPNYPDFNHSSTGEALWLRHDDPPWVKRQLQLLDYSQLAGVSVGGRDVSSPSCWSLLGNETFEGNGESSSGSELKYGT